jgi:hypothetical protein
MAADTVLFGESGLRRGRLLRNARWNAQSGKSGARKHTPSQDAQGSHSPKFIRFPAAGTGVKCQALFSRYLQVKLAASSMLPLPFQVASWG